MNRLVEQDDFIKKSIIEQLSSSVKEIQYNGVSSSNAVNSTEAANQLCIIIEAIFLHGLKDKLMHRFKRVLKTDVDAKPEPSFWAPLMIISHRQIIDQIVNLSLITTETGQCRAWIRQALNDCLLSSYLSTLKQDQSVTKNFYRPGAFLRDTELLDVAQRLIEGFKTVTLPCNSSLLNNWPPASLVLAGIWAPTLKTCPVAPCDDVAKSIETEDNSYETRSETSSALSSFRHLMVFDEDAALKKILSKNSEPVQPVEIESIDNEPGFTENSKSTGWSNKAEETVKSVESLENSFHALVDSYNIIGGDYIKTPNLRDVWQEREIDNIEDEQQVIIDETCQSDPVDNSSMSTWDFQENSDVQITSMQLGEICREKGLDEQNFECLGCKTPFVADQKFNVCAFTGDYYCDNCMSEKTILIPARVVHNWDFNLYPVSQKAYNYIDETRNQPLIDFKVLNPIIYSVTVEMSELQILRNQLNYLRAYLYTCREPVIGELQKSMPDYLYEHVHRYSVDDLSDIPGRILASKLQRGVEFGIEHVTNCWLCSQKGFICEICNKTKTIFPFDIENVYRCNDCYGVYHKHCLTNRKPCPKCKRKKNRNDDC